MTSKPLKTKKGAPNGNRNAQKHGLYSKSFVDKNTLTVEQRKAILDACISRMYSRFTGLDDIDQMSKCLNSLALAITAANNCDRTSAILNGTYTPIDDVLNALKYLDPSED